MVPFTSFAGSGEARAELRAGVSAARKLSGSFQEQISPTTLNPIVAYGLLWRHKVTWTPAIPITSQNRLVRMNGILDCSFE